MKRAARPAIGVVLALVTIGAGFAILRSIAGRGAIEESRAGSAADRAPAGGREADPSASRAPDRADPPDSRLHSFAGDPASNEPRRAAAELDAETWNVQGWVISHAASGAQAPEETGTLVLRASRSSPTPWRQEIAVEAGRFRFTAPADSIFEVERLELGGQPLMTRIHQFNASSQVEIEGWWVAPTTLHVVNGRTRGELRDLRFESFDDDPLEERLS